MKSARVMILAGVLASAAGCSSTDDFVGSWKYTSGTITTNCEGESGTEGLTGNITINEGSSSDLVLVDDDCSLKLTIDGDKATLDGSQSCTTSLEGGTATLTINNFTFTTDDGETARLSSNGTATISGGGISVTCTVTSSGDLEKL